MGKERFEYNKNGFLRATHPTSIVLRVFQRPRREDLLFCLVLVLDFFFFAFVEKRKKKRKKSGDFLCRIIIIERGQHRRRHRGENEIGHLKYIRRGKSRDRNDVLGETLRGVPDFFPPVRGGHGPGGSEETFTDDLSRRSMHDERSKHGRDETEDHRRGGAIRGGGRGRSGGRESERRREVWDRVRHHGAGVESESGV